MKKTEAKEIAKDTILSALGCAYYKISDDNSYTDEEKDIIISYINKYGEKMAKAIKEEYVTY